MTHNIIKRKGFWVKEAWGYILSLTAYLILVYFSNIAMKIVTNTYKLPFDTSNYLIITAVFLILMGGRVFSKNFIFMECMIKYDPIKDTFVDGYDNDLKVFYQANYVPGPNAPQIFSVIYGIVIGLAILLIYYLLSDVINLSLILLSMFSSRSLSP